MGEDGLLIPLSYDKSVNVGMSLMMDGTAPLARCVQAATLCYANGKRSSHMIYVFDHARPLSLPSFWMGFVLSLHGVELQPSCDPLALTVFWVHG